MNLKAFSGVVGIIFLILGIMGFFIDELWGIIHFDLLHNIIHLAVGVIGIGVSAKAAASKLFAKILGIVYVALAIFGFIVPELIGDMILETAENVLHLVVGAIALFVGYLRK